MGKGPNKGWRVLLIGAILISLIAVYLFQQFNYAEEIFSIHAWGIPYSPNLVFIINKTSRLVLNDILCMGLIYGLFQNRAYLKLAFYLFLVELLLILPGYFTIKLYLEGPSEISSPLLSPVHRMIINPLLMVLLVMALYYQQFIKRDSD